MFVTMKDFAKFVPADSVISLEDFDAKTEEEISYTYRTRYQDRLWQDGDMYRDKAPRSMNYVGPRTGGNCSLILISRFDSTKSQETQATGCHKGLYGIMVLRYKIRTRISEV